jgi:hypothetical protein
VNSEAQLRVHEFEERLGLRRRGEVVDARHDVGDEAFELPLLIGASSLNPERHASAVRVLAQRAQGRSVDGTPVRHDGARLLYAPLIQLGYDCLVSPLSDGHRRGQVVGAILVDLVAAEPSVWRGGRSRRRRRTCVLRGVDLHEVLRDFLDADAEEFGHLHQAVQRLLLVHRGRPSSLGGRWGSR